MVRSANAMILAVAAVLIVFSDFNRIRNLIIRTVDETGIKHLKTIQATQDLTRTALLLFHSGVAKCRFWSQGIRFPLECKADAPLKKLNVLSLNKDKS